MHPDPLTQNPGGEATFSLFGLMLPWKATLAIVLSTTLLLADYYYHGVGTFLPDITYQQVLLNKAIERTIYYLIIPLLLIIFIYKDKPSDYGFTLGDWRAGIKFTLLIWAIAAVILYFAGRDPGMIDYYTRRYGTTPIWEIIAVTGLDLLGWEFLFRGLLLFVLYRLGGPIAVIIQAIPFAFMHIGKPPLETFSTIFGGTMFGWVAWRTRSFIYPWLIHCFISLFAIFSVLVL